MSGAGSDSDRLINVSNLPQEVPTLDPAASTDIFDMQQSPVAQKFDMLMTQAAGAHRQQVVQQMVQPQPASNQSQQTAAGGSGTVANNYWHMRTIAPLADNGLNDSAQPPAVSPAASGGASSVSYDVTLPMPINYADNNPTAGSTAGSSGQAGASNPAPVDYSGLRSSTAQPLAAAGSQPAGTGHSSMTEHPKPAILELANNNDLNVATIAREAQARSAEPPDEVVVSLH